MPINLDALVFSFMVTMLVVLIYCIGRVDGELAEFERWRRKEEKDYGDTLRNAN